MNAAEPDPILPAKPWTADRLPCSRRTATPGQPLMTTLIAGDKRLISLRALTLGTRITTQFDTSRNIVREIHVNRGMLTARSAMQGN